MARSTKVSCLGCGRRVLAITRAEFRARRGPDDPVICGPCQRRRERGELVLTWDERAGGFWRARREAAGA